MLTDKKCMKKLIIIISIFSSVVVYADQKKVYNCTPSKEYITTYNFLKDQKQLELPEEQIEKVSLKVSTGCKNAAKRFIETFSILIKSEAGSEAAIKYAIKLANHSDEYQSIFIDIFVSSFSRDQLDLDLNSSLKLASRLSVDFKGDLKTVKEDFNELTEFCLSKKLNMSYSQCAVLAQRVVLYSEEYKKPVAKAFIDAYTYLSSNPKINMDRQSAIKQAESLTQLSPLAFENFKTAFEFQQKKYTLKDSLAFANKMAKHTIHIDNERLPASKNQNDQ